MSISSWNYMFNFPNAPYGFVFHFALMQNETKDQDYASLPDPLRSRKLKQKKTFNVDTLLFLNAFFILRVPRATGKVGNLTDDKLLRASAQVHQWHSRWLTSEAGVKLNVP
ncbi:hypothetical protein G7050_00920 [Dysgonomonas sp. HDW5A]|uniref:hypothetical protein n=1 Tax=Dysgonomonas sp. HDW5A TaxID=2714926 RepID=UPI00140A5AD1|nr:hypothetical protein [Dysgonomonas sp. HDW5A]QIK58474.1 hypothetical protein G7050_00920 [Dysgonomonas sp. HDW5A]